MVPAAIWQTEVPLIMNTSALSSYAQFLPLILIFGVFYFLLIRPQQRAQADLKRQLSGLKRGDRVVTGGGIVGTVARVVDGSNEIDVDIAPNVRVSVVKSTITALVTPKAANDTKAT